MLIVFIDVCLPSQSSYLLNNLAYWLFRVGVVIWKVVALGLPRHHKGGGFYNEVPPTMRSFT
jgi:hypothetical protein